MDINIASVMYPYQKIFEVFMMVTIILTYGFSFYNLVKLLRIIEKQQYNWIFLYIASTSLLFVFVFGYLLIKVIFDTPVYLTSYGILVIRPAICFMGGALASFSRASLIIARAGGHLWTLRKSKN